MADVQGVNYALTYGATPIGKVSGNVWKGRQRVLSESYEADAAAAGTDILIGKLNDSAVIHDFKIFCDALGTGVTLQLAVRDDDANVTAVGGAQSGATAAVLSPLAADIANLPSVIDTVLDTNTQDIRTVDVIIRIAGAAATGTIKALVTFVDG